VWVIGLLVLGAAVAGWFLSRRTPEAVTVPLASPRAVGSVRDIKKEAESILKVLEPGPGKPSTDGAVEKSQAGGQAQAPLPSTRPGHVEDASVLDEDSADPEVRLDLARAYIAMGDKEAARVILAEVIDHGDARQQNEAKEMLREL
jgi:pilus assembly protein FimV